MQALIIGAGIGGLAAAVALRRVGVQSLVLERAESIREIGAGLTLWSNAVNALRELGVEARVTASASTLDRNLVRTPAGRLLAVNEFGEISRDAGAPCLCVIAPFCNEFSLKNYRRPGSAPAPAAWHSGIRPRSWKMANASTPISWWERTASPR